MGSYDNVNPAACKPLTDSRDLLRSPHTADILDIAREVLEPVPESIVMLESQNRGRHQDSHLLVVRNGLESGTDCKLSLSESHVPAH